jgi:ferritin-like metal-binding protein YciE
MKLESMQDVFVNQLKDVLNAEKQLTKALPKMAKAAKSESLARAFEDHLAETEGQIGRLEQIFEMMGKRAQGKHCHGMEGLIKEGEEAMEAEGEDALVDTEIIAAAQRVEHYEIAAYGCLVQYAELMGLGEAATLLNQSLEEEKAADKKLTQVNESEISANALSAGTAGAGASRGNGMEFSTGSSGSGSSGGSRGSSGKSSGSSSGSSRSSESRSMSGSSGSSGSSSSGNSGRGMSSPGRSGSSGSSGHSSKGRNGGSGNR